MNTPHLDKPEPQGENNPRKSTGRTLFALHKVSNGWLISDSQYLTTGDVPDLVVFNNMRDVASYLIRSTKTNEPKVLKLPKRDERGHFIKSA